MLLTIAHECGHTTVSTFHDSLWVCFSAARRHFEIRFFLYHEGSQLRRITHEESMHGQSQDMDKVMCPSVKSPPPFILVIWSSEHLYWRWSEIFYKTRLNNHSIKLFINCVTDYIALRFIAKLHSNDAFQTFQTSESMYASRDRAKERNYLLFHRNNEASTSQNHEMLKIFGLIEAAYKWTARWSTIWTDGEFVIPII